MQDNGIPWSQNAFVIRGPQGVRDTLSREAYCESGVDLDAPQRCGDDAAQAVEQCASEVPESNPPSVISPWIWKKPLS
jgi:hypothetical protein